MDTGLSGLSAKIQKEITEAIEQQRAEVRREVAVQFADRLTTEIGQAVERVVAEYMSPVKSAILFDEPLKEDDSIVELRLPKMLTSHLRQEGFGIVAQLRDATDTDILDALNVGPKSLDKIDAVLAAAGHPRKKRGDKTRTNPR